MAPISRGSPQTVNYAPYPAGRLAPKGNAPENRGVLTGLFTIYDLESHGVTVTEHQLLNTTDGDCLPTAEADRGYTGVVIS